MNEPRNLRIEWEGPFRIIDFLINQKYLKENFRFPGVYIHTTMYPDGTEKLTYVGKATGSPSLFIRQQQHYASLIGGLYQIPKEFRTSDIDWIPNWEKHEAEKILTNKDAFKVLIDECYNYAQARNVFLAVNKWGYSVKEIERNLLYDLNPIGTNYGTKTRTNNPIDIIHVNALWKNEHISKQIKRYCMFA